METRRVGRILCPHCDQLLTIKTFKAHKRKFYDSREKSWLTKRSITSGGTDDDDVAMDIAQLQTSDDDSAPMVPVSFDDGQIPGETSSSDNESNESDFEIQDENDIEVWTLNTNSDDFEPDESEFDDSAAPTQVSFHDDENHSSQRHPLVGWILSFLFFIRYTFRISDTLTELIVKFFKVLLTVLSRSSDSISRIAESMPGTLYSVRTCFTNLRKHIIRYVVCRKCYSVYNIKDCTEGTFNNKRSKLCAYRRYPRHPQARMRQECGLQLLKSVELANGNKILYPYMTYCYLGVKDSIQNLLSRKNIFNMCKSWNERCAATGFQDVYDGQLWKDFLSIKGKPFLLDPRTLAFTMNIDWFQPYKHTTYSIGAIYLTVMNLPRNIRYKRENVILCGLMPGPKEPERINPFLVPLVQELLQLWRGVEVCVDNVHINIKAALLCVACDIPAGRKVCGFLGCNSHYGCSKCMKYFPGSFGSIDHSGFERHSWPKRSCVEHRKVSSQIKHATTKSAIERIESQSGYRHTVLLDLPYFDTSRMLIVDPMHNLFIGTAKRMMKLLWIERQMISESDLSVIQRRVVQSACPPDIGRIPLKIESGFSQLNADQLKNWVNYFSVIALRDIIIDEDMECWRHFVLASRLLCQKQLQHSDVVLADALLLQFCKRTERMYGKTFITPNMHLHAHIKECIFDYGPLHGFWLFSFERYNGILGQTSTNNRSIEIQFMRRFQEDNELITLPHPNEFSNEFSPIFTARQNIGSISETLDSDSGDEFEETGTQEVSLPDHYSRSVFTKTETNLLQQLYSKLENIPINEIEVNQMFRKYATICIKNKHMGSWKSRSKSSSIVLAGWSPDLFGINSADTTERPVRIEYFAHHYITMQGQVHTRTLCSVLWFKPRPDKDIYGKPVTIWEHDLFEPFGIHSVIPVQMIKKRTVSLVDKINSGETVLFVAPCVGF